MFFIEPINVCPTIGATFLKKIHPNSTFTYKVLTNNLKECCYVDYIRIIKEEEILKLVPLSVDSSFYYQRDKLLLQMLSIMYNDYFDDRLGSVRAIISQDGALERSSMS